MVCSLYFRSLCYCVPYTDRNDDDDEWIFDFTTNCLIDLFAFLVDLINYLGATNCFEHITTISPSPRGRMEFSSLDKEL